MDLPEGRIRSRDGEPVLEVSEPSPSRAMVAEAMILAGAVAAIKRCLSRGLMGTQAAPHFCLGLAAECPQNAQPGEALLLRVQLVDSLRDQLKLVTSASETRDPQPGAPGVGGADQLYRP